MLKHNVSIVEESCHVCVRKLIILPTYGRSNVCSGDAEPYRHVDVQC